VAVYPFPYRAPGLTFRRAADLLRDSKLCTVERLGWEDNEALYRFWRTADNGDEIDIIQYVEDDSWEIMPSTFRSLCARLDIDGDFLFDGTSH
jgi:hypothetical protein